MTTRVVMRLLRQEVEEPHPLHGLYLKAFNGSNLVEATWILAEALTFDQLAAALDFWQQQSETHPWLQNGEPNRPLTSFDVSLEPVVESS